MGVCAHANGCISIHVTCVFDTDMCPTYPHKSTTVDGPTTTVVILGGVMFEDEFIVEWLLKKGYLEEFYGRNGWD